MEYFRTFKSTTVSSMIKWHTPKNMNVLLKYTDQISSLAEDPREWRQPPCATSSFDEGDHLHDSDRYSFSARKASKIPGDARTFGLSGRTDLHEWVSEELKDRDD